MELKKLDKDGFDLLCSKWLKLLKDNGQEDRVINVDYTHLFKKMDLDGCWHNDIKECFNKSIYICVVDKKDEESGILEIIPTQRGNDIWIKMLNVHFSPLIELETDEEITARKRLDVFKAALKGIFRFSESTKGSNAVKIYGRTEEFHVFLRGMHDAISILTALGTINNIDVSIQGRWLIFHANKK